MKRTESFNRKIITLHLAKKYQQSLLFLQKPGFRTAGIYTFSNFFSKGLSFLLLPLFTNPKYLTPEDNGLLSLYAKGIIFLMPFISLGVLQSVSVDYFKMEKKEFKDLCTTGLFMAFTVAVFSLLLFFLFRLPFLSRFSFPFIFIWALPLVSFLTFLYEMLITIVRNREDAKKYLQLNLLKISLELGLALVLIVFLSWGWLGRVTGLLLASGSIALYGIWFLYKNDYLFGKIRKDILLSELKFSVPVILMQLSMFSLFSSDSFFLSGITGDNAMVGIYGLACIFGSILITFSSALIQYMVPQINKELAKKEVGYTYIKKQFLVYSGVMTGTYLILLALVPLAYYLFINPLYFPGIKFYYLISTGYFLWTIATFLYRFPLFFKSKKKLIFLGIASIMISLGSNYFFIANWGAQGAAISVCLSYFLVLLLISWVTKDYLKQMFLKIDQID